jgi:hypothetical protein
MSLMLAHRKFKRPKTSLRIVSRHHSEISPVKRRILVQFRVMERRWSRKPRIRKTRVLLHVAIGKVRDVGKPRVDKVQRAKVGYIFGGKVRAARKDGIFEDCVGELRPKNVAGNLKRA